MRDEVEDPARRGNLMIYNHSEYIKILLLTLRLLQGTTVAGGFGGEVLPPLTTEHLFCIISSPSPRVSHCQLLLILCLTIPPFS